MKRGYRLIMPQRFIGLKYTIIRTALIFAGLLLLAVGCTMGGGSDEEDSGDSDSDSDSDSDTDGDDDGDTSDQLDTGNDLDSSGSVDTGNTVDTGSNIDTVPVDTTPPVDTGNNVTPQTQTPTIVASELLGRPTATSMTVNVVASKEVEAYFEYGTQPGTYTMSTPSTAYAAGDPIEAVMTGLLPSVTYYYRIRYRGSDVTPADTDTVVDGWIVGKEYAFTTQRTPGSTFKFTIQSDSHLGYDAFFDADMYRATLQNVQLDAPDFHIDLGDAFSLDDQNENVDTVQEKYLAQREFFGIVSHSSPLFLVLGNHENEEGWNLDDKGTNVAASLPVMGANARKRYYLNPIPDDFYTGNSDTPFPEIDGDGLLEDYYAWEWGDALFVAIEPYWYTMTKTFEGAYGGEMDDEVVGDRWDWTLGDAQYAWLEETLANSSAKFKFVFSHQVAGGSEGYGRGGANVAGLCEWGGHDPDSNAWVFDESRPSWKRPIHQLMLMYGVNVFFHGHDHVYAKEDIDGMIYQESPMAAYRYGGGGMVDYRYGFDTNTVDYANAEMIENSGHLRTTVTPDAFTVEYVRAFLAGQGENGSVATSYSMSADNNFAPVADSQTVMAEDGVPRTIVLQGHDFNGDHLDVGLTELPENGTFESDLTSVPPTVTYTAPVDFIGTDRFSFIVDDGVFTSSRAYVNITVVPAGTLVETDTGLPPTDTEAPIETDTDRPGDTDTEIGTEMATDTDMPTDTEPATSDPNACPVENHNVACMLQADCDTHNGLADATFTCEESAAVCCALPPMDPCPESEQTGVSCLSAVDCIVGGGAVDDTVACADRNLSCCTVP